MITNYKTMDAGFTCITGTGNQQAKTISFYSDDNIQKFLGANKLNILYYRHFNNIFDALAHKLMLENLCNSSLNCIISRMNPGWEDLRERLEEELTTHKYEDDNE